MTYTIMIGNGKMLPLEEDSSRVTPHARLCGDKIVYYEPVVELMSHYLAPEFKDDPTGTTNRRDLPVNVWWGFLEKCLLKEAFEHLMPGLNGFTLITDIDARLVSAAKIFWEVQHPQAVAGFGEGEDDVLARLSWLDFWMSWAYKFCEQPGIYYGC